MQPHRHYNTLDSAGLGRLVVDYICAAYGITGQTRIETRSRTFRDMMGDDMWGILCQKSAIYTQIRREIILRKKCLEAHYRPHSPEAD